MTLGTNYDESYSSVVLESGAIVLVGKKDRDVALVTMGSVTYASGHYVYDTFGQITSIAQPTRFGYTGREWDADAEMYYYRARWYDQRVGRFLSEDPKGFDAGDANLYRYVGNNAINLTDPSGMMANEFSFGTSSLSLSPSYGSTSTTSWSSSINNLISSWNLPSSQVNLSYATSAPALFSMSSPVMSSISTPISSYGGNSYDAGSLLNGLSFSGTPIGDYVMSTMGQRPAWESVTTPSVRELSQEEISYVDSQWMYRTQNVVNAERSAGLAAIEPVMSRVSGAGRMVAGTVTGIASVAISSTGLGAIVGIPGAAWSGDQVGTGLTEFVTGHYGQSLGERAISKVVPAMGGSQQNVANVSFYYNIAPAVAVGTTYSNIKAPSLGATFGSASSFDYRATFFDAYPELKGQVVVHHAVPQRALTLYPDEITPAQIHSLENLRGIPKEINSDLHLRQIGNEWRSFYKQNPNATQAQLLQKATEIDAKFGPQFKPPVGGGN